MSGGWVVVVPAAGSSRRMGAGEKKEYAKLGTKTVLEWTVSCFVSEPSIRYIVIVVPASDIDKVVKSLVDTAPAERLAVVAGGDSRQDSVLCGLVAAVDQKPEFVLVHDGARPWMKNELLLSVMRGVEEHGACIPVLPSTDALKRVDANGRCLGRVDRAEIVRTQTPQGFRFSEILGAHRLFEHDLSRYADDAEVLIAAGGEVYTVAGDPGNHKITYAHDLIQDGER